MVAPAASGMLDPIKPAKPKYPVILSDALLGKPPTEVLTGVRYNHRPNDAAPSSARIKASPPVGSGAFDLAFRDAENNKYDYTGTRAADENQYVLVFDPEREAFVLHKLDSLFNMNLVSTPTNSDAASLKKEHPHLTGFGARAEKKAPAAKAKAKAGASSVLRANNTKKKTPAAAKKEAADEPSAAAPAAAKKKETTAKKPPTAAQKKQQAAAAAAAAAATASASASLPLPEPSKPKAKHAAAQPPAVVAPPPPSKKKATKDSDDEDSDEDSDDDGGLLVEYPGAKPPGAQQRHKDFSPAFPPRMKRFEDFIQANGEEDEDADAEGEDEDPTALPPVRGDLKLPSPVGNAGAPPAEEEDDDDSEEEAQGDVDDDLELALLKELDEGGEGEDEAAAQEAEESDISEED